jgi:Heparan-alpha-glucosaminide N-acetyltransferase, catalytic
MAAIAEPVVASVVAKRVRIESIDVVRGVIMILMALDHVRDFFGNSGFNPTDPATTTIPLFFTRWITHFCAPVFFLLTGTGAYLSLGRKSKRELSRFLLTRGLWLIFLELTIMRCLGWQFNFDYHLALLLVLWALGWAMIVLSALVYLPASVVTTFGVVMIATHNLFDSVQSSNPLWSILHSPNFILNSPGRIILCDVCPHSLDRCYSGRIRVRTDLQLAVGTPQGTSIAAGHWPDRGIRRFARDQSLRRSTALEQAKVRSLYRAFVLEYYEVSAIATVPSDDIGSRAAFLVGGRWRNPAMVAARAHHRQSAHVLLPSAHTSHPSARDRGMLCPIRADALDVRVAGPW